VAPTPPFGRGAAILAEIASMTAVLVGAPAMAAAELVALATRVVDSLQIDTVHVAPAV
jgi:hypothetical protein